MKKLTTVTLAFLLCLTAIAGNRKPAGETWDWIEAKVLDGYHYWLEGAQIGNTEVADAYSVEMQLMGAMDLGT